MTTDARCDELLDYCFNLFDLDLIQNFPFVSVSITKDTSASRICDNGDIYYLLLFNVVKVFILLLGLCSIFSDKDKWFWKACFLDLL